MNVASISGAHMRQARPELAKQAPPLASSLGARLHSAADNARVAAGQARSVAPPLLANREQAAVGMILPLMQGLAATEDALWAVHKADGIGKLVLGFPASTTGGYGGARVPGYEMAADASWDLQRDLSATAQRIGAERAALTSAVNGVQGSGRFLFDTSIRSVANVRDVFASRLEDVARAVDALAVRYETLPFPA